MYSFTFNNYDLSAYGLAVTQIPRHPGMADPRLKVHELGDADGTVDEMSSSGPLFLALNVNVQGTSDTDFASKMDSIRGILDPIGVGEKLLVLHHQQALLPSLNRGYYARLHSPIIDHPKGIKSANFDLHFRIRSGHPVSTAETTQAVTVDESPEEWDIPASGTVVGNKFCYPTYTFTQTDSTAVTVVALANTTRDETLTWTGSLADDDQLRINTESKDIHKSEDSGTTWVNAIAGKSSGSSWPKLTGGVANAMSLTLTGSNAGTLSATYRGRFI